MFNTVSGVGEGGIFRRWFSVGLYQSFGRFYSSKHINSEFLLVMGLVKLCQSFPFQCPFKEMQPYTNG